MITVVCLCLSCRDSKLHTSHNESLIRCSVSLDEWSRDEETKQLPLINITVANSSDSEIEFPCWLMTGSSADVLRLIVEGEEIPTSSTYPHSSENKAIIKLPAKESIVWQTRWPSSINYNEFIGKKMEISIRWFDKCNPVSFTIERGQNGFVVENIQPKPVRKGFLAE